MPNPEREKQGGGEAENVRYPAWFIVIFIVSMYISPVKDFTKFLDIAAKYPFYKIEEFSRDFGEWVDEKDFLENGNRFHLSSKDLEKIEKQSIAQIKTEDGFEYFITPFFDEDIFIPENNNKVLTPVETQMDDFKRWMQNYRQGDLGEVVESWASENENFIRYIGVEKLDQLSAKQAILLSIRIAQTQLKRTDGSIDKDNFHSVIKTYIIDHKTAARLLERKAPTVCRHYVIAAEGTFEYLKKNQAKDNKQLENVYLKYGNGNGIGKELDDNPQLKQTVSGHAWINAFIVLPDKKIMYFPIDVTNDFVNRDLSILNNAIKEGFWKVFFIKNGEGDSIEK